MGGLACENEAKAPKFIEEITKNTAAIQKDVLTQILSQNAQTEYLKRFDIDVETFKSKTPVVTYEDLKPFIQRAADGDRSPILTAEPISELIISSGTSSNEPKLIPMTKDELERRRSFDSLLTPVINQYVKGLNNGKGLFFKFTKPEIKTRGGLAAQSGSSGFFKNSHMNTQSYDSFNVNTSPDEAILCADTFQSMYTQMLCGLYEREKVVRIGTNFATGIIQAIKFLQLNWRQLTHDIRTGSLNPKVTDALIRECMDRVARPDPDLAGFITRECEKDNWEGIIIRIWPNTKFLQVLVSGAMAQYIPILDYYSGGLPKVSMWYASSECFFGINLNPLCEPSEISYTIMPNMAYFEFLPSESNSSSPQELIVDLVDVEIGKEYEPVITTYASLYRYQMDDIVRVTGFHNLAPQFQFVRRKNVILNIDVEKTTEVDLRAAVESASRLLLSESNSSVIEYTSYADTTTIPGHYVMYWEILANENSNNSPSDKVLERCCLVMEESLSTIYHVLRVEHKTIGSLEIRIVKNGTFDKLMDHATSKGVSISQYKVPKCVSAKPMVNLLNSRVVSRHFSPSLPHLMGDFGIECLKIK